MSEERIKQLEGEVAAHKQQLELVRVGLAFYESGSTAPCACRLNHATQEFVTECPLHTALREELEGLKAE